MVQTKRYGVKVVKDLRIQRLLGVLFNIILKFRGRESENESGSDEVGQAKLATS